MGKKVWTKLKDIFAEHGGCSIYLVGGAVRDMIMGKEPHDYDFTTALTPDEIKQVLIDAKLPVIPIGEKFGTIATIMDGMQIEITTFRKETYNPDSRKPNVEFATTIYEDLKRRDFTINAIAYDPTDDKYLDPYDGKIAIEHMALETPTDPDITLTEDPLRMLRAIRFISRGFNCVSDLSLALKRNRGHIHNISQERIVEEFNKIFMSQNSTDLMFALHELATTGLLFEIFPEFKACYKMEQNEYHHKDVWEHTKMVVSKTHNNPILRWASLFHDIGKGTTKEIYEDGVHFYQHEKKGEEIWYKISKRLKGMEKTTIDKIGFLIRNHLRPASICGRYPNELPSDRSVRRLFFDCQEAGEEMWDLLMDHSQADCTSGKTDLLLNGKKVSMQEHVTAQVKYLRKRPFELIKEEEKHPKLPTGLGTKLMEDTGKEPGPWIRKIQDKLQEMIVDGDLPLKPTIEECLEAIK